MTMLAALKYQTGRLPHFQRQFRRDQAVGEAPNPVRSEIFAAHRTPSTARTSKAIAEMPGVSPMLTLRRL